jgi:hypothetical protein
VYAGIALAGVLLLGQVALGGIRQVVIDEASPLELVQTCLVERDTPFMPVTNDLVALSADRGALSTVVQGNRVTLVLGGSEKDAERLYDAYVTVAPSVVRDSLLDRRRKVVYLWANAPTHEQREFAYLCTLDAQQ